MNYERSILHLLHRAAQTSTQHFATAVGDRDITSRQYIVLMAIAAQEGVSQVEIVSQTGIDRSTLADVVKRLLKRGYVARRRRKDDGRAYAVRLTEAGRRVLTLGRDAARRADAAILGRLAPGEQHAFEKALRQISEVEAKPDKG